MSEQSSAIVSKVWGMCNPLRDDGVSYGDYLEQLTYLIFLKMSDEYSRPPYKRETGIPEGFTWADMHTLKGTELEEQYKATLEKLGEQGGILGKIFKGATNKISSAAILYRVVQMIDNERWVAMSSDVKGEIYEGLLQKNAEDIKSGAGQYFTPRPIIEFCVKMMKPEQDWDVLDPSCGSGGFLLHALDYMRKQAGDYYEKGTVDYFNYWHDFAAKHLYGIEINDEIARVAKMNMIVHDDGHTNVISHDALESIDKMHDHNRGFAENRFDLILTNPPFGSTINLAEKPYLSTYELGNNVDAKGKKKPRKNQSSEVLFVERIWQFLKPGTGKAAIVLPDGILTNSSMQYVRDFILEKFQLLAVVSLPQCAFAHFGAGVKASVIFVRKRKENERPDENEAIFMAAPELIGYDATGRKTESQLDEIVAKYEEFRKDATPFFA